jgi:hypothetical protein
MEINKHKTRRREGGPPTVECGNRQEEQKASRQIPGIHDVQQKSEKAVSSGKKIRFLFDVKKSIGIHGMDKAQNLFDRQDDFIKIHRSVRVPGVKGAYYEDKREGCSLVDCIMSLKLKGTFKKLFHSLDQAKGNGAYYSLIFIDMYDMEAREVIHNLAAYLAHHHGTWIYKYFAAEDVEVDQTCYWYWYEESQSMRSNKEQNVVKYYELGYRVSSPY